MAELGAKAAENTTRKLVTLLRGCKEHGQDQRSLNANTVKPSSLFGQQEADEIYGEDVAEAIRVAMLRLVVVEDLFIGLARLIDPPAETAFSQQTIPRPIAEAAARASFLLDLGVTARERAARQLNDRANTLSRGIVLSVDAKEKERLRERLAKLWEDAEHRGHEVKRKDGKPTHVDKQWPNATDLVGLLFQDDPETPLGRFIYRYYSQVTHATPGVLLQEMEVLKSDPERKIHMAAPVVRQSTTETIVALCLLAWVLTFDNLMLGCGWPTDEWVGWRKEVFKTIRPLVERRRVQESD